MGVGGKFRVQCLTSLVSKRLELFKQQILCTLNIQIPIG